MDTHFRTRPLSMSRCARWRAARVVLVAWVLQATLAVAMAQSPPGPAAGEPVAGSPAGASDLQATEVAGDDAPADGTVSQPIAGPADDSPWLWPVAPLAPEPGLAADAAGDVPSPVVDATAPVAPPAPAGAAAPMTGVLFRVSPPAQAADATDPITDSDPDSATAAEPPAAAPASAPSFLFGTIHFGSDAELGLDATALAAALASADTLVGEIDIDTVAGPALDHYRWLPPERPLSTLVDADAWLMARHLLPDVAPSTLERMKPWMVLALVEARGESLGDDSLDVRLQRMARARGMPLVQLETLEDQLRALDCVPPEAQATVLQERLKTPWVLREMSQRALAHYRGRDLDAWLDDVDRMPGLGKEARTIEQQARRCLVEDRNARWMPALLALLATGGRYVAVGAIHLPGEQGLLAALVRAGYRIEAEPL